MLFQSAPFHSPYRTDRYMKTYLKHKTKHNKSLLQINPRQKCHQHERALLYIAGISIKRLDRAVVLTVM